MCIRDRYMGGEKRGARGEKSSGVATGRMGDLFPHFSQGPVLGFVHIQWEIGEPSGVPLSAFDSKSRKNALKCSLFQMKFGKFSYFPYTPPMWWEGHLSMPSSSHPLLKIPGYATGEKRGGKAVFKFIILHTCSVLYTTAQCQSVATGRLEDC